VRIWRVRVARMLRRWAQRLDEQPKMPTYRCQLNADGTISWVRPDIASDTGPMAREDG